jgi:hypothetical protein
MKDHKQQLHKELLAAGASAAEIDELLPIASRLSILKSGTTRDRQKANRWVRTIRPMAFTFTGLALGMFLVIVSQTALPTSLLYPVQKFSDSIAIKVHPQFRANVMMKRAQQVNQLVSNHAASKQILATLADYSAEASSYKSSPHASYAAFEYCQTNLQQAASSASPTIKKAILSSLQSLEIT